MKRFALLVVLLVGASGLSVSAGVADPLSPADLARAVRTGAGIPGYLRLAGSLEVEALTVTCDSFSGVDAPAGPDDVSVIQLAAELTLADARRSDSTVIGVSSFRIGDALGPEDPTAEGVFDDTGRLAFSHDVLVQGLTVDPMTVPVRVDVFVFEPGEMSTITEIGSIAYQTLVDCSDAVVVPG